MISEFSCPGGAREPISPTQLYSDKQRVLYKAKFACNLHLSNIYLRIDMIDMI